MNSEFSFASRNQSIERFAAETFDFLVVGGGITGAAVARDAASRGLKVALIEKHDFASGTSSASSKLVHGGLRYLENFEFKLVFESLSERAHLIRTQPNMVRWLKFYLPVYQSDARGKNLISLGLWLYDLLSLFRAPHFHRRLSKSEISKELPSLKKEGLVGGFTYYDASMWDDVMCVENARAASELGAAVVTRFEAISPLWKDGMIRGLECRDVESGHSHTVRAHHTVICVGPYTDLMGDLLLQGAPVAEKKQFIDPQGKWMPWLKPSRGTHLVFAKERFPVPGALLLSNEEDGRISFVIPREDFGSGVVIVGTTDGPSPNDPDAVLAEGEDILYLLRLLKRYFPELKLTEADIISRYVGVRPLMDPEFGSHAGGGGAALSKVSREHHIGPGPGHTTFVAGGKYTTHRTMALEIVDHALESWREDFWQDRAARVPAWHQAQTEGPMSSAVTREAIDGFRAEVEEARRLGLGAAEVASINALIERYGADARTVLELHAQFSESRPSPAGLPYLESQLRYAIRFEMVLGLDDFYFRRLPLYLGRQDHARDWIPSLSRVWAEERGFAEPERVRAVEKLERQILARDSGHRT
ncbi:MAG: glycerol-3-phosphate dehydrogenase/oxidase [Cryobacterium sp.]|nr:glycerol-3-phosphate dehydrogenase/oxidase [Oligoflexia bacterium]